MNHECQYFRVYNIFIACVFPLTRACGILGAILEAGELAVGNSVIGMQVIMVQYCVHTLGCKLACAMAAMEYGMMVKVGRYSAVDRRQKEEEGPHSREMGALSNLERLLFYSSLPQGQNHSLRSPHGSHRTQISSTSHHFTSTS